MTLLKLLIATIALTSASHIQEVYPTPKPSAKPSVSPTSSPTSAKPSVSPTGSPTFNATKVEQIEQQAAQRSYLHQKDVAWGDQRREEVRQERSQRAAASQNFDLQRALANIVPEVKAVTFDATLFADAWGTETNTPKVKVGAVSDKFVPEVVKLVDKQFEVVGAVMLWEKKFTCGATSVATTMSRASMNNCVLPAGAVIYLYGEVDVHGPLKCQQGEFWLPSVDTNWMKVQIQAPPGTDFSTAGFTMQNFATMVANTGSGAGSRFSQTPDSSYTNTTTRRLSRRLNGKLVAEYDNCVTTGSCTGCGFNAPCVHTANVGQNNMLPTNLGFVLGSIRDAVAHYSFVSNGYWYMCSGGLVANGNNDPLFVTANHCIDNPASASSVELYFKYQTGCSASASSPFRITGTKKPQKTKKQFFFKNKTNISKFKKQQVLTSCIHHR